MLLPPLSQVLLGEVNAGLSTTQVVVKELKASASVQDQMQFLEEVQQYRSVSGLISFSPSVSLTVGDPKVGYGPKSGGL